jgi:sulfite dehydrogenase (cytochrome) subunit A
VTDDGGRTWRAAELGREHDPYAWRLWSLQYAPRCAAKVTLYARATDSRGRPRGTLAASCTMGGIPSRSR